MWLRQESKRSPLLIPLQLEEAAYWYNWEQTTDIIKFIFSVDPFDASVFKMNALILPETPTRSAPVTLKGGIGTSPEEDVDIAHTWNALNVPIHVKNPSFNKVNLNDINSMQKNDALAEFALGLYA